MNRQRLVSAARRMASSRLHLMSMPQPVVISGPSGSGKSTLLNKVMSAHPNALSYVISHTTRSPRPGERNGVDYHFVTETQMRCMIDDDEFVEHAIFAGNYYGTSKRAIELVQESGRKPVLDVDIHGVINIKQKLTNAHYIFITTSLDTLEKRLRKRGVDSEEAIAQRLNRAKRDMEYVQDNLHLFNGTIISTSPEDDYAQFMHLLDGGIEF